MDIYQKTGRWKWYLAILGIVITVAPLYYSNHLANNLAEREKTHTELLVRTLEEMVINADLDIDVTFHNEVLEKLSDIRVVTINNNQDVGLHNYPEPIDTQKILKRVKSSKITPLTSPDYKAIYWEYPDILNQISYLPWIQLLLLLIYVSIAYALFNLSRKEEQNRVWVGMAKETAHQLGTPISGLMGWMEELKSNHDDHQARAELIQHIEQDIYKLQQVSDRFSKIGSVPELKPVSIKTECLSALNYIKPRAARKIKFIGPNEDTLDYKVMLNTNLFSWVLENLLRNSLDAMEAEGTISLTLYKDEDLICIDISDTGKGIPAGSWETIFRPGFSTKKRGWGLGLSLARRIIENYHQGKIYVKESEPERGTTIRIELKEAIA
ncbi:MAG: HAMP domain-containing histidine kinase [Saprospiraceae bacterium]|nr:HAMP domain-containing histidine kinase [Saprospiraceae bacterium]MBK7810636.1 HAMP domain-containing histidine kinase [Saprospiraceae bacterium]MBK9630228.1 HAMP domain-containing histidine kinase [Saprospiraceae bacterium]